MSTSFHQFSLVDGVRSGAGALRIGAATDMVGNLLGMLNTTIETPQHEVEICSVGGHARRRFGGTNKNAGHAYDYPVHNVVGSGNGPVFPQSKPGYLHGNGGGGNSGYGIAARHQWLPADNVSEAQEIAFREAHMLPHFVPAEHLHYVDRTKESMIEQLQDQEEDYQRMRIKDLMSKGFTEEEISKQIEKEREKAIEHAKKQPFNPTALIEATLAKHLPSQYSEDFINTSVAPGAVPAWKDASSVQRAEPQIQGGKFGHRKAMAALRQEQKLRGDLAVQEPPQRKTPLTQTDILQELVAHSKREHDEKHERYQNEERRMIDQQGVRGRQDSNLQEAMKNAMNNRVVFESQPVETGRNHAEGSLENHQAQANPNPIVQEAQAAIPSIIKTRKYIKKKGLQ